MKRTTPIPPRVSDKIHTLLHAANNESDIAVAWRHLEDAHVLSQPWARPHIRVHVAMLSVGWRTRDRSEVIGQVSRLVLAGPGSALGRYPQGNTGRANVSAFQPMPIRDDIAQLLATQTGERNADG